MSLLSDLLAALARSRNRAAAIRDLRSLSLHELADIGIAPDQIGDVVDSMARPLGHGGKYKGGGLHAPRTGSSPSPAGRTLAGISSLQGSMPSDEGPDGRSVAGACRPIA